ncbi:MAG: lipid A export permease/ATP-binding protein MsbA [Candidatus Protistobacter heckmanni]|nr:lipid A export permease/ATP-binding protein MsbA [Candidatus Protistobacter heckmanni]
MRKLSSLFSLSPNLRRLVGYLKPHRLWLAGALLSMGLVAATETAIPALMKPLLDKGFEKDAQQFLWMVPVALIGLALIRGVAQFGSSYLLNRVSNTVLLTLRDNMFASLLRAPAAYYVRQTASSLINAVVFEVNQVLSILSGTLVTLIRDSLTVLGLLCYLFWLNWRLTLIVAVILPVIGFLMSKISRRLRQLNRDYQTVTNALSYIVEETAAGYKVVKVHGGEPYELARFREKAERLRSYSMRMAVAGGLNQPITQLLAAVALSVIASIAIAQSGAQQTTVGGFAAFITAMLLIVSPLKHLADISQPLQRGLAAADMIFGLIDEPGETAVLPGRMDKPMGRARGEIEFDQVSFSYSLEDGGARTVLHGFSLRLSPGQLVALVGPSGSGKTTIANLLPRFLAPKSGAIRLDGLPIEDVELADLRRQFSLVSQEVVLFNDSIAANVAYGTGGPEEIDIERVRRAIDAASLSEMVAGLPEGLDSSIGDNGNKLSGGQKQRLAIARAIYKDAPVLILDEATSALDSESERQVQAALEKLMQGRTTLVIAHRLSTIERADQIVVLDHGRIAEQGAHAELLALGGLYAGLYRTQEH